MQSTHAPYRRFRLARRSTNIEISALKTERDYLSSILNASPMPMLLVDTRGDVIQVNSAVRDYCFDYEGLHDNRCGTILKCVNALSGAGMCGKAPACSSCHILRALLKVLESGIPCRGEASIKRNWTNGTITEAWILYSVEAVSLGKQRHALLSFMDITGRKREETLLRIRGEEFRALVENSPDVIARYDRLCRRIYINPAMERLAGTSADSLLGKTPSETFVASKNSSLQVHYTVKRVIDSGIAQENELVWKNTNGEMQYFQGRYVPEYDQDGAVESVLGITRDITSLRRTEALLLHAQKMESIGTLAGGVAHDFNNILTVIMGYTELLHLSINGDEKKLGFVREITDSVKRGSELTRSLLTFCGKREPQKQQDDLNKIVTKLQKSMSRLIRSDISLTFQVCTEHLPVYVDSAQIEHVLINLMINARDAINSEGRIHVATRLLKLHKELLTSNTVIPPGNYGIVSVSDDGIGMTSKTRERIFEPFFTTKEIGKGTGLGLAIVFGIVGSHNGCIAVTSESGNGSHFEIYLPLSSKPGQENASPVPEVPKLSELHGSETVLLVDDDNIVLEITGRILTNYGYKVMTALNGAEAVDIFKENRDEIQVVVTDLIMPRMNGREAIKLIRKEDPKLPVILVSGHTFDIIDLPAVEALDIAFLPKPVYPQKLLATIRSELERAR
jgi:PAS domain S-box-containing protein